MNCKEYEIIDGHAHIFPEKIAVAAADGISKFYDLPVHSYGSCEKLIAHGDVIGVKKYAVCSVATVVSQVSPINRFIASACREYSQFIGLGTLHPYSENLEAEIAEIKKLGLCGIKLHSDFQQFDIDSPEAYRIYEIAEGNLPVLLHCGDSRYEYSAPNKVKAVSRDFPGLKIICAHFGGYERWDEACEYIAGLPNVKVDTCSSMAFMSVEYARRLVNTFGVENCIFGTDFPMWRHEDEFNNLMALGMSRAENQRILAGNFKDFLEI